MEEQDEEHRSGTGSSSLKEDCNVGETSFLLGKCIGFLQETYSDTSID